MRSLPKLATRGGAARLPLSDATAQKLIAALLSDNPAMRCRYVTDALACDPTFAVWALCRATADGHDELRTISQLADCTAALSVNDWLGETPVVCLPASSDLSPLVREHESRRVSCGPSHSGAGITYVALPLDEFDHVLADSNVEIWADRCATAIGIATLACRWAEHAGFDAERASFLGLVHAAPEWLLAACGGAVLDPPKILPDWLMGARLAIESSSAGEPTSPAECVAAARRVLTGSNEECPFAFDSAGHGALVAEARENWRRATASGDQLCSLSTKLAKLERLEVDFQRTLESEKLDSLKELAYGASHEINNPLANISARAQTLLAEERDPERRRKLAAINSQAFRAHEMIADMMLFARPPQPKLERLDLAALVAGLVEELAPWAAEQKTQLVLHAPAEALVVLADKTQLAVAVRSLCINALEALSTGGHVELTLARHDGQPEKSRPAHETVQITVADDGPGIPPAVRRHVFDPFYSGREAGRGLGLGLSKCWRIVTLHGGRIELDSAPGQGARFTISLPIEPQH